MCYEPKNETAVYLELGERQNGRKEVLLCKLNAHISLLAVKDRDKLFK